LWSIAQAVVDLPLPEAARDLFVARGFQRLLRAPMERKLRESGLWHEQRRIKVDLHFGIGPAPLWGNARSVSIGAYGFEGFGASDVVLVSCVNAVREYWSQSLYRYCDIHEMVSNYGEQNWDTLLSRSNALRDKRSRRIAERLDLIFGPNRFDREFIHLPSTLSPMYYLIRPARLATAFARSLPQRLRR
jgi:hypothetical protein